MPEKENKLRDSGMCPQCGNMPENCNCKEKGVEGEAGGRELTAEEEVEKDEYVAALGPALAENQAELERLLADEEGDKERISELRENIEILQIQIVEVEENL